MSESVLYLSGDGERATLLDAASARPHVWQADEFPEAGDRVAQLCARAKELAVWISKNVRSKRAGLRIVLDVDGAECFYLRAQGRAQAVLRSALHSASEELEVSIAPGSFEVLASTDANAPHAKQGKAVQGTTGFAAVHHGDSFVRLLCNELDRLGFALSEVVSLWHGVARAWASTDELTAVVMHDEHRLVWAWGSRGRLFCGGMAQLPAGGALESACARLRMDWLTWSAQLSCLPASITVVAHEQEPADQVAQLLAAAIPASGETASRANATTVIEQQPLQRACAAALPAAFPAPSQPTGATQLVELSYRPTRKTRLSYMLLAASLLGLCAAGVGGALRLSEQAGAWDAQSRALVSTSMEDLREQVPDMPRMRVESWLRTQVREQQDVPPPSPPPTPPPIYDEVMLILGELSKYEQAKLEMITLSWQGGGQLRARLKDRNESIAFENALSEYGSEITWVTRDTSDSAQFNRFTMVGERKREGE